MCYIIDYVNTCIGLSEQLRAKIKIETVTLQAKTSEIEGIVNILLIFCFVF